MVGLARIVEHAEQRVGRHPLAGRVESGELWHVRGPEQRRQAQAAILVKLRVLHSALRVAISRCPVCAAVPGILRVAALLVHGIDALIEVRQVAGAAGREFI